jgi:CheY-like chemotaxis protein
MATILLIDDNEDFRDTICAILLDQEHVVLDAPCPDEAFAILKHEKVDMIVCDIHMPFTLGPEFNEYPYSTEVGVRTIRELYGVFPHVPLLAWSAATDSELIELSKRIEVVPVMAKPNSSQGLCKLVTGVLEAADHFRMGEKVQSFTH